MEYFIGLFIGLVAQFGWSVRLITERSRVQISPGPLLLSPGPLFVLTFLNSFTPSYLFPCDDPCDARFHFLEVDLIFLSIKEYVSIEEVFLW